MRAWGDDFHPEKFLGASSFRPCNVFRKGDRRSAAHAWDTSGITIVASESDDFAQQILNAIEFLKTNRSEILRLKDTTGVEGLSLDFGVNRRNDFLQSYLFPLEIISLARDLSLALEVSIYGTD